MDPFGKVNITGAWLEEAFDKGLIKLPANAPSFEAAPTAWSHAKWIGPGAGWVDPKKEAEASNIRMDSGLSTLEKEAAEQGGDWKDVQDQRARERKRAINLGLDPNHSIEMSDDDEDSDIRDERENRENAASASRRVSGRSLVPQISRQI